MNIKQKLTYAFAAVACVPVIVVALLVIFNLRQQAQDTFVDSSTREIRQVENAMKLFFDAIDQSVTYLAGLPQISGAHGMKNYSSPNAASIPLPEYSQQLVKFFEHFAKAHPAVANLAIALPDGTYTAWPDAPGLNNYDPRQRPWYQIAMAQPGRVGRTAAYYWPPANGGLIASVRTIHNSLGQPAGAIALDVSLKQLTDLVQQIRIGESGYLLLVENSGNVLVDPGNPAHNFKPLAELGEDYPQLIKANGLTRVELNGKSYMANVWPADKLGWRFIGLIERDEVMASANRLTWQITLIAVFMVGLFAALGAALANMIVKPIRSVADGLEGIAQGEGDLTRNLEIRGRDETSLLARWFNQFLGAIRDLVQRIGQASESLSGASGSAMQVAHDMNDAVGRQREAVELVSTAFNEMVATANEVARSCSQASFSAEAGQRQVHDGQLQIDKATGSVQQLSETLRESAQSMQVLEQDSKNINAILDTIRSIAEQTNLLALNAAIEAARAGEQGRGFAVVADEVRALAKRTADSTGEIDTLLGSLAQRTQDVTRQMQTSLEQSRASVERIQQARDSFELIRGSVDQIKDQNTQIATAAEEQHQVAEDINRHIAQIHEDALLVEQLASTSKSDSQRLSQLSGELHGLVGRFRT